MSGNAFGDPNDPTRRDQALRARDAATRLASSRYHPPHESNGDEAAFVTDGTDIPPQEQNLVPFSFTKGLPHDPVTGLIQNTEHYAQFVKAIESGSRRDFRETPLGHEENKGHHPQNATCKLSDRSKTGPQNAPTVLSTRGEGIARLQQRLQDAGVKPEKAPQFETLKGEISSRAWESQSAGFAYDVEGPDAQAVTMPPAPGMNDGAGTQAEFVAEMAEVYAQALLRDVPFSDLDQAGETTKTVTPMTKKATKANQVTVGQVLKALNDLHKQTGGFTGRVVAYENDQPQTLGKTDRFKAGQFFRGHTKGDTVGPYLSQFILQGNFDINQSMIATRLGPEGGRVNFGAQQVDQRTRYAAPVLDYMTTWPEWFAVQCAANFTFLEAYEDQIDKKAVAYRLILTPRDLSTYVHYDALYQAYLNACLWLLNARKRRYNKSGKPLRDQPVWDIDCGPDGNRFDAGIPFQDGDDLDHQQGFAHFGGPHILSLVTEVATRALKAVRFQKFNVHRRLRPEALAARFEEPCGLARSTPAQQAVKDALKDLKRSGLLDLVRKHNAANNGKNGKPGKETLLLPMAFAEGSPMHPAYGAGHATVAGACVTILKAFFNDTATFNTVMQTGPASATGETQLIALPKTPKTPALTVGGELDKLAANISIGRDWAGVHFYSDYLESIRLGEEIAIGILEEQKLMFRERFSMSLTSFDGIRISI
ncbi:MAG: vanadium-dependent haloperoxidase [Planctomycetota bacterium]